MRFPSHLFVWVGIEQSGFSARIAREKRVKPLGSDLIGVGGGGDVSPYLILWRGTCPGRLSPPNGDLGSTQILTRHYGAQSQTIN
jgi:hypothetical protein